MKAKNKRPFIWTLVLYILRALATLLASCGAWLVLGNPLMETAERVPLSATGWVVVLMALISVLAWLAAGAITDR